MNNKDEKVYLPKETEIYTFVSEKINKLLSGSNESMSKALLAKLRRGIGKSPGSIPEIWSITLEDLPPSLLSKNGIPTHGERAVHTALTLFAMHQQGNDCKSKPMSKRGEFLGTALRKLIKDEDDEPKIKRRFDIAATSGSIEEISHHLRGIVGLLKAENLPLDYPKLAAELYKFQIPAQKDFVKLKWGQDFYSNQNYETKNNERKGDNNEK